MLERLELQKLTAENIASMWNSRTFTHSVDDVKMIKTPSETGSYLQSSSVFNQEKWLNRPEKEVSIFIAALFTLVK